MGKKGSNGQTTVLDVPVEFGGVSIGDATARIGVRIDRSVMNINAADDIFCGHRLTGRVLLGGTDDQPGQTKFVDDIDHQVDGTFDVKRIGVNAKQITTGLTFSLADVDIQELAKFSKGSGRLVVHDVGELPDDAADDDEDGMSRVPGTLRAEGPWRDVKLDTLFEGSLLKSLKEADITTVGALSDYTAGEKRLTDIGGIGPGKAEKIENRMIEFWEDNPQETAAAT